MKIYTRTGDKGMTSIVGGSRLSKDDPRIEAYGTVDELNSWLGALIASPGCPADQGALMTRIQSLLFDIGAHLAGVPAAGITPANISALEESIDQMESRLPALNQFILPGGTLLAARANIARTVCRRAERQIVALSHQADVEPNALTFINRLSDWLFTFGRFCNHIEGNEEKFWQKQ